MSNTLTVIQWWGYKHMEGTIHVKRFFSWADVGDARTSPFVDMVVGPFDAASREQAEARLAEQFRR